MTIKPGGWLVSTTGVGVGVGAGVAVGAGEGVAAGVEQTTLIELGPGGSVRVCAAAQVATKLLATSPTTANRDHLISAHYLPDVYVGLFPAIDANQSNDYGVARMVKHDGGETTRLSFRLARAKHESLVALGLKFPCGSLM